MAERVRITDVSPRDGLQNEPGFVPTEQKAELVELLCKTGVDEVEVTSFVSPKWVPQLGDARELLSLLASARAHEEPAPPSQREGGRGGGPGSGNHPPALAKLSIEKPARVRRATSQAKHLRRSATGPERFLWDRLKDKQLKGLKFRRQEPFGPYILDFYCVPLRLCVELDGQSHAFPSNAERDRVRDEYLAHHGVRVLRFPDDQVLERVETVLRAIWEESERLAHSPPTPPAPLPLGGGSRSASRSPSAWPHLSALVPNARGFDDALTTHSAIGQRILDRVSFFTAASETFSKKNTNASITETLERFCPIVPLARNANLDLRGYVSCAIACPFEGPIAPARVAEVAAQLATLGIPEVDLGDTIGAGTPENVSTMLRAVQTTLAGHPTHPWLTLHLHDTFGHAAECVRAALDLGIRSFDGSVAGLGGCPYASRPGKPAPGNIDTQLLVRTIHEAGYDTGVDLDALARAAEFARSIVAASRARAASAPGPEARP